MSDQGPSNHGSELELVDKGKRKRDADEDEEKSEDDPKAIGADSQLSMQSIDEEFMCAICLNTLTEPYTIIPCLHSFDKGCLASWWRRHSTCPTCKSRSTSARPAFQLKSIITHLSKKRKTSPPKTPSHSNEEIFPGDGNNEDEYLSDVASNDDDDSDTNAASLLLWPCITCRADNPTGYVCPYPIPLPTAAEIRAVGLDPATATAPERFQRKLPLNDPSVAGRQGVSDHSQCERCSNYVPNGFPNGIRCTICSGIFCSNVDPQGCPMGIKLVARSNAELPLMNARTLVDFFPAGIKSNAEEMTRFENYIQSRSLGARDVLSGVFDKKQEQTREDLNDAEADRLWGRDSRYCSTCVMSALYATLFDWWKEERKRSLDRGDHILSDQPDCWYGRECRTQTHNRSHAERYNVGTFARTHMRVEPKMPNFSRPKPVINVAALRGRFLARIGV